MLYCSKCGRKLGVNDQFCPACGEKNSNNTERPPQSAADRNAGSGNAAGPVQQEKQTADPNAIQYVYVNKKTGRITGNPRVKTKSEGCLQFVAIAFAAVAIVLFMVAGSVALTGYLSGGSRAVDDPDDSQEIDSVTEVSSLPASSETGSDYPVSSEEVSSVPQIPEELTAQYMQKKIKGKWKTDVPYKAMSLPGTFEFDGSGRCKCSIKAFLFSKKFEGNYTIKDGGECRLTLDGMSEYTDDDTMVGDLRFVNDNTMEFTVEDTVWKLSRVD
jgi:hypothetical protein